VGKNWQLRSNSTREKATLQRKGDASDAPASSRAMFWLDRVAMLTSSHEATISAPLYRGGLASLARCRADREAWPTRPDAPSQISSAGMWLVLHRDSWQTPWIRVALTHVAEFVRKRGNVLLPADALDNTADPSAM
jgi:DNA-binding transcriptional LysR family regulator